MLNIIKKRLIMSCTAKKIQVNKVPNHPVSLCKGCLPFWKEARLHMLHPAYRHKKVLDRHLRPDMPVGFLQYFTGPYTNVSCYANTCCFLNTSASVHAFWPKRPPTTGSSYFCSLLARAMPCVVKMPSSWWVTTQTLPLLTHETTSKPHIKPREGALPNVQYSAPNPLP